MAKSKILTDMVYNNCSLEDTLLRLLAICSELGDDEIINWIDSEQTGYKSESDVPCYRIVRPVIVGSYYTQTMHYTDKIIDISKLDKQIINELESIPILDSIRNIESIGSETQMFVIPPSILKLLSHLNGYNLYKANNQVVGKTFGKILAQVKNRLVKIILKLESEFGNLDDLDITSNDKENTIIIQELKQIIYDKSISVGDNTTITKSKIINEE